MISEQTYVLETDFLERK